MRKQRFLKTVSFFVVALMLLTAFVGCSSSNKADFAEEPPRMVEDAEYGYVTHKNSVASDEKIDYADDDVKESLDYTEKIIRNVTMLTQTKEYDRALAEISSAVKTAGGYEESLTSNGKGYDYSRTYCRSAKLVARIPAEKLDDFLNTVGGLVNVISKGISALNVTTEYYDIASRIKVLESERAAYEEMLRKSTEVSSMLEIERRLYDVIEEIESYETTLRYYDNKVAYSTVTISLEEVIEYTEIKTEEESFWDRFAAAFLESWSDFFEGALDFIVWLVYAIPTLLVIAAIAFAILWFTVFLPRKKKAKKDKDSTNNNA